jgi:Skp family chaperone for outer membrane proteins
MRHPVGRTVLITASLVVLALAAFGAGVVGGARKPPTPPVIATINVETVINGLDEWFDIKSGLSTRQNQLETKVKSVIEQYKDEQKKFENLPAEKRAEARDRLDRLNFEAEFETQYGKRVLDGASADALAKLYEKITENARQYAQKNGYTIVISDDQSLKISSGDFSNIMRQISLKRMLYVDNAHDITQELMTSMNNAWIAAGGKHAPPPTPAPPAPGEGKPAAPHAKPGG